MIPNHPPADRDLREHVARRAELLALLDAAEDLEGFDAVPRPDTFAAGREPDHIHRVGDRAPARRRGFVARYRLPLLAAASVAVLVTGITVGLPDDDTRSQRTPPAAPSSPAPPVTEAPATAAKPPTLPAGMLPVPAGREMPEALARDFVRRCVSTVPNPEGRAQPALAATFRPYLAVRTPRSGLPDLYFAVAVDDRARIVECRGDADPETFPSPTSGPIEDPEWMARPVEYQAGSSSTRTRWTVEAWGRYSGAVTRVTTDHGRGEQDVLMGGGVWYGTLSSSTSGEPEPNDEYPRVRAYDKRGELIWDSERESRVRGSSNCGRTPDGRVVGYLAPDPNGSRNPLTCPPAVPWTAGEPNRP